MVAGIGFEIFLFETGSVGSVHLNKLEVSEGVTHVGESVTVLRVESIVSEFIQSCEHFKKNACVTDRGEQSFTSSLKNPHLHPSSTSWH